MKLLYLTHKCPYPPNKGERIRCFNILKHLARHYELHLVYPSFSYEDRQHSTLLRSYTAAVTAVPMHSLLARTKCLLGLLAEQPLTLRYFFSKTIAAIVQRQDYDVLLADCSSMAQYAVDIAKPKIVDFVDVDSDKWRLYAENSRLPMSLIYRREFQRLRLFEEAINKQFDACVVVSDTERQLLQHHDNVVVIPNGIDCQFFAPRLEHNASTLIFTGAMDYFPNIDGVAYFCSAIWPLIKGHVRETKFIVAGMQPHARIRALASDDIQVTGYVSDIRDYLARATICVVPLRIAKGIQNKILEAMAMGLPVVATTVANTGVNARDKEHLLLADSPEAFAQATVMLLNDPHLRSTLATNARRFVQDNFSWATHLGKLEALMARLTHT